MGARTVLGAVHAAAAVVLTAALPLAGFATGHRSRIAVAVVPPLPVLGARQTVDRDDVGDPYILAVRRGVSLPPGLSARRWHGVQPWDASDSWTDADTTTAEERGWYVLFGTTDWQANIPVAVSTDLVHWTNAPDALPVLPSWAARTVSMTWAPAADSTPHGYVLYFSTETAATHQECIGAATSDRPAGPYTDRSPTPLVCQVRLGGSIDPSVVREPHALEYLVWKNDGNGHHALDSLWAAPLAPDGLRLAGPAHRLLSATDEWDDGIVEAPAMVPARIGGWWLFYAAGGWDSVSYATGLAYCPSVTGPCLPTSAAPFLATTESMVSPGGLDTVTSHDGELWAAWTALQPEPVPWAHGRTWYDRVLEIAPIIRR